MTLFLWQGVPDEMLEGVSLELASADALCRHARLLQIVVQAAAIIFVEDCPDSLAMIGALTQGESVVPGIVERAIGIARARGRQNSIPQRFCNGILRLSDWRWSCYEIGM
jgi:hypothetical protein